MTAKIDAELEQMISDNSLRTIEITDAAMRLKDGNLILRAKDLVPQAIKQKEGKGKTPRERQKKLYERRKSEGWKKIWVDPSTLALSEELGGIENIPPAYENLKERLQNQATEPKSILSMWDHLTRPWSRLKSFFR